MYVCMSVCFQDFMNVSISEEKARLVKNKSVYRKKLITNLFINA